MSFSIAVKVDAWGNVSVDVIHQAGGCPFTVAQRKGRGGEDLEAIPRVSAVEKIAHGLTWSPHALDWSEGSTGRSIEAAVRELARCLPPPEAFDEDGRPYDRRKEHGT